MGIWIRGCWSSCGCSWKKTCGRVLSRQPCDLEYLVWRYEGEILRSTGNRCWSRTGPRGKHRWPGCSRGPDRGAVSTAIASSLLGTAAAAAGTVFPGCSNGSREGTNTFNFPRFSNARHVTASPQTRPVRCSFNYLYAYRGTSSLGWYRWVYLISHVGRHSPYRYTGPTVSAPGAPQRTISGGRSTCA